MGLIQEKVVGGKGWGWPTLRSFLITSRKK